jgi:hypothetical protein
VELAWLGDGEEGEGYDTPKSARETLFAKGAIYVGTDPGGSAPQIVLEAQWLTCEVWDPVDDAPPTDIPAAPYSYTFWRFKYTEDGDTLETFDTGALTHGMGVGVLIDEVNVPRWARLPAQADVVALGDIGWAVVCLCFYRPVKIKEGTDFASLEYWTLNGDSALSGLIPADWVTPLDPPVCGSEYAPFITSFLSDRFGYQTTTPSLAECGGWEEYTVTYPLPANSFIYARALPTSTGNHVLYSLVEVDYGDGYPLEPGTPTPETPCAGGFALCIPADTDPLPISFRIQVYIDGNDPIPVDCGNVSVELGQDTSFICPE